MTRQNGINVISYYAPLVLCVHMLGASR